MPPTDFWIPDALLNRPADADFDEQYFYHQAANSAKIYFRMVGPENYASFWQHKGVVICLERQDIRGLMAWLNQAIWKAHNRHLGGITLLGVD